MHRNQKAAPASSDLSRDDASGNGSEHAALVAALHERVKELDCLYAITRLSQRGDLALDEILSGACDVVARAWQYPAYACVKVVLGGHAHATANFRRPLDRQSSPIRVEGEVVGRIEVGYLEKKPESAEGPFLREERHLLDAVAEHLGRIVEARKNEEHLRLLSQELLKAQEHERQRIARELHDDVAQTLSTTRLRLEGLAPLLGQSSPGGKDQAARETVRECAARLGTAVASLRDLAYGLLPPALEQLGLAGTAFRLCEEYAARHGLRIDFTADGMDAVRLSFETRINLYRVLQESLSNACRHAAPSHITVRLIASYPHCLLRVADDGRGFDADSRLSRSLEEKRMGLWSMRERMRLLGGRLRIRTKPGKGTTITAEAPILVGGACQER